MSQFESFDFYLLRMPVLPYNQVLNGLRSSKDFEREFAGIIQQPLFQEAIFLASTELYSEMQKLWGNISIEKKEKINATIYKYLLRMATRSTPYGLFAGCALGKISEAATNIDLAEKGIDKIYKLDISCYSALADKIPFINDELLRNTIFYPNSSIYRIGQAYRYYEYKVINEKRSYFLSSFSQNEYIDAVLTYCENGASFNHLIASLNKMQVYEEEAFDYIKILIANQIIISEYTPKLTGGNQLDTLLSKLFNKQLFEKEIINELIELKQVFSNNRNGIQKNRAINDILEKYVSTGKKKDCLQADVVFQLKNNTINTAPINEIITQIEKLLPFNTAAKNNDLERFKNAFYQKFENREILLSEAIDTDLGVGYGKIVGEETFYTPLIDDLILKKTENITKKWTAYEAFILDKFIQQKQEGKTQITISDEELTKLSNDINQNNQQQVSATFAILGSIYANSQADVDQLNFSFLLKNCGGNSAMALMSRFGSEQSEIRTALFNVANYEKEIVPDKILAEIIHLPEGRVGNVLVRPKLFDYEIPFLGAPSVSEDFKITLDDLFIAVKNNRLILLSKKLKKEVLPRLTNAHNFSTGLPVYKFLSDLQFQNEGLSIEWNWGILDKQPFLPRVVYKNIILKRSQWLITIDECKLDKIGAEKVLTEFIKKYKLPDLILLVEGDNELLLDMNNKISRSILVSKIGKTNILLYEYLHQFTKAFISGTNGLYDNEIIIPVKNKKFAPIIANKNSFILSQKNDVFFTLGSEWLYFKIYAGYKSLEAILIEIISPMLIHFVNKGIINKWFFVRYQDPESHLRIRLNVKGANTFYEIIKYINNTIDDYIKERIIQKLEYATYFQETEKYRPWAIDLCEHIFYADSQAVLNIIYLISQNKDEENRWLIAISGVDAILTDFNYLLAEKKEFIASCFLSFFKEFNGDKQLMVQLNEKFREKKLLINQAFNTSENDLFQTIYLFIQQRSKENSKVYTELLNRIKNENEDPSILNSLINNFAHLFLNRLFVANHRLHEMVVYHHLLKYYESALGRVRNND